jgi:hypothetical protein
MSELDEVTALRAELGRRIELTEGAAKRPDGWELKREVRRLHEWLNAR